VLATDRELISLIYGTPCYVIISVTI